MLLSSPLPTLPLTDCELRLPEGGGLAAAYAAELLGSLGARLPIPEPGDGLDAAIAWAESGLMVLCGEQGSPPLQGPAAMPSCARGVCQAIRALAPAVPAVLDGAGLLTERAAIMGLQRHGAISPNQSCHLLPAKDAWFALNLARAEDWELLPAWLEHGGVDSWSDVHQRAAQHSLHWLLERGRTMGLPIAPVQASAAGRPWYQVHAWGRSVQPPMLEDAPLVIDLSSLWAGPLCSHLLMLAGARVIKVESERRLDGARQGSAPFFDLLNGGKQSVVLDLTSDTGRRQLHCLLHRADIVVEGSRPRALRQMGIHAEELVVSIPGLTWVGISGYGRSEPEANWVAFGDDAAVAAGVAASFGDRPLFCGDALADPLTGLHGALAALGFWRGGGGAGLDLSLRDVTAHCLAYGPEVPVGNITASGEAWRMTVDTHCVPVEKPKPRIAECRAVAPGRDTRAVLREFDCPC